MDVTASASQRTGTGQGPLVVPRGAFHRCRLLQLFQAVPGRHACSPLDCSQGAPAGDRSPLTSLYRAPDAHLSSTRSLGPQRQAKSVPRGGVGADSHCLL